MQPIAKDRQLGGGAMNAAAIARALGDAGREGRGWRCRCPLHGGCSLVIRDGRLVAVRPPGTRRTLITYESLARLLAPAIDAQPAPRRRGRPRKQSTIEVQT
jgi:hypothetical protein